jgi:hypothetical protein
VQKRLREQGVKVRDTTAAPMLAAGFTEWIVSWEMSGEEVADRYPSLSLLNAAAKKGKVTNNEHAAGITILQQRAVDRQAPAPAVDEAAAMREAAEFVRALRAMRGAS